MNGDYSLYVVIELTLSHSHTHTLSQSLSLSLVRPFFFFFFGESCLFNSKLRKKQSLAFGPRRSMLTIYIKPKKQSKRPHFRQSLKNWTSACARFRKTRIFEHRFSSPIDAHFFACSQTSQLPVTYTLRADFYKKRHFKKCAGTGPTRPKLLGMAPRVTRFGLS